MGVPSGHEAGLVGIEVPKWYLVSRQVGVIDVEISHAYGGVEETAFACFAIDHCETVNAPRLSPRPC